MTPTTPILPLCVCREPACLIPYGFCHCECGEKTAISSWTDKRWGSIRGMPYRFIKGHGNRIIPIIEDAAPFKIAGVGCRLVSLANDFYTIISASDYERVMQHHWTPFHTGGNTFYVFRNLSVREMKETGETNKCQYLHDFLMPPPEGKFVDHWNRNGLDNRREGIPHGNLRFATPEQNSANSGRRGGISGYKGAFPTATPGRWVAIASIRGKRTCLGRRDSPLEAHELYMKTMRALHGEFARGE